MANLLTSNLRQSMVETQDLDIPYGANDFVCWLRSSQRMSKKSAERQVDLIREADCMLWEPGDGEMFTHIAELIDRGKDESETLRSLFNGFAIDEITAYIEYLKELIEDQPTAESSAFLNKVIVAYRWYLTYLSVRLGFVKAEDLNLDPEYKAMSEDMVVRYNKVPLEDEFKDYLKEVKYPANTRDKMLSSLRKLNDLVIDNGRGDSKLLDKMVKEAAANLMIYSKRLTFSRLFHHALSNINYYGMDESALKAGYSAINAYISFLIHRQKKQLSK